MLLDLGSGRCIPCKEMAPILVSLRETYRGRLDVVFLDVWDDPDAAEKHGVSTIPTQIFLDAQGQERFRHEGFYSREEILAKWRELGVELDDARVEPRHDGGGPS
jgi:thioredoxin 1